jgi:phosphatidylglycerol:prolipoprotein diacylglycerol transferase
MNTLINATVLHDNIIHICFDILAAVVFLVAVYLSWIYRFPQEMTSLADKTSGRYFASIGMGAVIGSYFLGTFNSFLEGDLSPSRSVLGGLAGAIVAVEVWKRKRGMQASTGYIYALPLALMIAVGRIACAMSGLDDDTYGIPTGLKWGWNFGDGIPRHPVAIYEIISMTILSLILFIALKKRVEWYPRIAFYIFAGVYGAQRFVWEFLKPYPPVFWKLNVFHIVCLGMVVYALYFTATSEKLQKTKEKLR